MITSCFQYHVGTSYDRNRMEGHVLDWENQPGVFKEYPGIQPTSLPEPGPFPEKRLSEMLRGMDVVPGEIEVDVKVLSTILFLTCSLTAKVRQGSGQFYFRSVPSAGALYPAELYLASKGIAGLQDGLYHFSVARHGLHALRTGPFPGSTGTGPTLTFFLTAIFFRSCWKYRDRGYRYCLLDTGHLLQNLVLAARSMGRCLSCSYDFSDEEVNRLLGLDPEKEVCLAVASGLNGKEVLPGIPSSPDELPGKFLDASRTARRETAYSAAREAHRAGGSAKQGTRKDSPAMIQVLGPSPAQWERLPLSGTWPELVRYKDALFSRRSRRNFVRKPMPGIAVAALIEGLRNAASEDVGQLVGIGLLVNAADARKSGCYLLDPETGSLGMVKEGRFMEDMARICLDQAWLGNAALHFLFMADLKILEDRFGPRGYRYAMLEAGRMGETLYLCAASMGYGCCGIGAYYDEDARRFLELGENSRLLYLAAVGPVKRT
jgi:SagB-type dehydrogenase family enzyme